MVEYVGLNKVDIMQISCGQANEIWLEHEK